MIDTEQISVYLEPHHDALAARLQEFVESELSRLPHPGDDAEGRTQAREILGMMGEAGISRYSVPEAESGAIDLRACCLIRESLGAASTLADAVFALQCLGVHPIALAGSKDLRDRWLSAVADGTAMAAFAMTEPEAGSDVGSMTTSATLDGDAYVINGRKILISNAGIADFYTLFARTEPTGGSRGVSAFVVPADTSGLDFVGPQVMSEPHPLGEIEFQDCRVPTSSRLGDEGDGFKLGMMTLDRLRTTVAAAACGMATRALEEAMQHARSRRQFGKALSDFQLIQHKLAKMSIDLAAARLLVYHAAHRADAGAERVTLESAMAKAYATEAAQRIVDDAVQIVGGRGALADHPVDRLYRAVRSLRIYEGTTEIQYLVIARELLKN